MFDLGCKRAVTAAVYLVCLAGYAGAQAASAPDAPPSQQSTQAGEVQNAENSKRILGFIPNFQTINDVPANQRPLATREKYVLSLHQMFDFSAHIGNAFQSSIQQATNGQPHYGQGWNAFGKRFLASEGDQVTSSLFISGLLPALLKQDPRYFRRGTGSTWSRTWYAMERTVITRKDDGKSTFNTSQTLGQLMSAAVSTSYYPQQDRSVSSVFANTGTNLLYNSGYNVLREYYPDILRKLFHRRKNAVTETKLAQASSTGHT